MTPEQRELVLKLGRDRLLAHQALFKHRHPDETPAFHSELIKIWHSLDPAALVMVFREGGKSTIAEEALAIGACYQLFHNAIIIGSTEKRACERLRAIKHELETNEAIIALFGVLVGEVWNETEVILANGVRLIAVGRGQSLRGTKHLHYRPDYCFCDDIEEEEHVKTPEARAETLSWFIGTLLPALDKNHRIRLNATPLDRDALPFVLKDKLKWPTYLFPIEYRDGKTGQRTPTWPARYPLEWIDKTKSDFEAVGKLDDFQREYMCTAEDPSAKMFTDGMFHVKPTIRSWQPVYAFIDPARTTGARSSSTGFAVWSWIGNRLVVWDGGGKLWKPDEIVAKVFAIDEEYRPVLIGVEEDGLHEFLMQPLRHEMVRRATVVPVAPYKAPRGKASFIAGLQPFFQAGEISFAKELPELRQQLLNFPSGRIDAPNALAYALIMRPGQVVYEEFSGSNVVDKPAVHERTPCWLCLNAGHGFVTGVLCQFRSGVLSIIADWVVEGDPSGVVSDIIKEAALEAKTETRLVAPAAHFGSFNHLGLRGAVARIPAELHRGSAAEMGRIEVRQLLSKTVRNLPALQVGLGARFTLAGFAAGFAREIAKTGLVKDEPREGMYRVLMEGLESLAGFLKAGAMDDKPNWQYTENGQAYISALPGTAGVADAKDAFLHPDLDNDDTRWRSAR